MMICLGQGQQFCLSENLKFLKRIWKNMGYGIFSTENRYMRVSFYLNHGWLCYIIKMMNNGLF